MRHFGGRVSLAVLAALSTAVCVNMLLLQSSNRGKAARVQEAKAAAHVTRELADAVRSAPNDPPVAFDVKSQVQARSALARTTKTGEPEPASPDTIRAIQRELAQRGYDTGTQDGVNGLITRAAILAFEHDHGLPLTAEPTEHLLRTIVLGDSPLAARPLPPHDLRRPQVEQLVRTVQQSLAAIGYAPGRVDGRLSEETARAIREFEMDQALPVTGRISGTLVAKLARLAASGRLASGR